MTQPVQHQPPGIEETIAGMLPAGTIIQFRERKPKFSLIFAGLNSRSKHLVSLTHDRGKWFIDNSPIIFADVQHFQHYVSCMQAAARVCGWLNEHWKPE